MPRLALENTGALLLPSLLPLRPGDRVLEVGCGRGALSALLAARVPFRTPPLGIDGDGSLLRPHAPRAKARLIQAEAWALPFPDRQFTVLLAGHQIRAWDDDHLSRFLAEAWRTLTHNGVLVLWEVAPSRSAAVNRIWCRLLSPPGRRAQLRPFAEIGRLGRDAGFAWIQTLRVQPMLWPPGPRVAVLMRKEYYDAETVDLGPGETPD